MSDKKRYYWLKLKEDFFDEDAMSWLEEQPNGKLVKLADFFGCTVDWLLGRTNVRK